MRRIHCVAFGIFGLCALHYYGAILRFRRIQSTIQHQKIDIFRKLRWLIVDDDAAAYFQCTSKCINHYIRLFICHFSHSHISSRRTILDSHKSKSGFDSSSYCLRSLWRAGFRIRWDDTLSTIGPSNRNGCQSCCHYCCSTTVWWNYFKSLTTENAIQFHFFFVFISQIHFFLWFYWLTHGFRACSMPFYRRHFYVRC